MENTDSKSDEQPAKAATKPNAPPVAAPQAATPPKKSVEEWAKAKGMFHEFTEGKRRNNASPKAPLPKIHNAKFVQFHRARASHQWAPNEELTEAEFDAAVATADAHVYR